MTRVILSSTPLHAAPHLDSTRETDALFGEAVDILANQDGWSEVILITDGYRGWVESRALGDAPAPDHYVRVPRALMTATPDIKSPAADYLPMMAQVKASPAKDGSENDIMAIHGKDGIIGYTPAGNLRRLGDYVQDWVAIAESLIGIPYRWGGRDSIGIDCSALVQLSLAAAGIKAMRNSGEQEKTLGSTLSETLDAKAPLRRGDLVFWKGHVGIMSSPEVLLHANMYHAMTAIEPLAEALVRLEGLGLTVTRFARI